MPTYRGHKNWNHWNVSLWINNDQSLYELAKSCVYHAGTKDRAARDMLDALHEVGLTHTKDGAPYSFSTIREAINKIES